ncbi:hypothetical protein [Terrimonas alba]
MDKNLGKDKLAGRQVFTNRNIEWCVKTRKAKESQRMQDSSGIM